MSDRIDYTRIKNKYRKLEAPVDMTASLTETGRTSEEDESAETPTRLGPATPFIDPTPTFMGTPEEHTFARPQTGKTKS